MASLYLNIYLNAGGDIATLDKDFPVYRGQYQNVQLNVYVPLSMTVNFITDNAGAAVKCAAVSTDMSGKENVSIAYPLEYVTKKTIDGIEYSLYQRTLPKEFTQYAGITKIVTNITNVDLSVTPPANISNATTQICNLEVLLSANIDTETEIKTGDLTNIYANLGNLQENKQDKTDTDLITEDKTVVGAINYIYTEAIVYGLDTKLDKLDTDGNYVYTHNGDNQSELEYGHNIKSEIIVQRDSDGQISTPTPTLDNHAANKEYIDDTQTLLKTELEDYSDTVANNAETAAKAYANSQFIPLTQKGSNNGVAQLDGSGRVPSSQLPGFVDDVLNYDTLADFPLTGEDGKLYIADDTNLTYRWNGSGYTVISPSLALGETAGTAYRGDRGKAAYDTANENLAQISNLWSDVLAHTDTLAKINVGSVITNLNNLVVNGFYTCESTAAGAPNSNNSWFVIHNNSNVGTLAATQYAVAYNPEFTGYVRTKTANVWGAWTPLITPNNENYPFVNGTISDGHYVYDCKSRTNVIVDTPTSFTMHIANASLGYQFVVLVKGGGTVSINEITNKAADYDYLLTESGQYYKYTFTCISPLTPKWEVSRKVYIEAHL